MVILNVITKVYHNIFFELFEMHLLLQSYKINKKYHQKKSNNWNTQIFKLLL